MDFIEFLPLVVRDEETIRAQVDSDANAYLNSGEVPIDTSEAGFFFLNTQAPVMEIARLYDDLGTKAAAAFIPFAWGIYLDYHGQQLRTPRKDEAVATGEVTITGTEDALIPAGTQFAPSQVDPEIDVPVFVTTTSVRLTGGTGRVSIEALDPGYNGNVAAHAISVLLTTNADVASVDNETPTLDGVDVEDDEDYRSRLMLVAQGRGPGNITDYIRWGLEEVGVGRVSVQAAWDGPNTVMVTLMARDGSPVSSTVVDRHQDRMDPVPGQSRGEAPTGANVTVNTPTIVSIDITARIEFLVGYSLDGEAGTVATRTALIRALNDYVNFLDVGEDVVKNHIEAQFFRVRGVYDVEVTLPAADITIDGSIDPPEVARTGTITLS